MRRGARDLLVADPGLIALVDRRIYQQGMVPSDALRPYLVLSRGGESTDSPYWAFGAALTVYAIHDDDDFGLVDQLIAAVIAALDQKTFADPEGRFTAFWEGDQGRDRTLSQEEGYDPPAISRSVGFLVYQLSWLTSHTYEPDPVTGLNAWTQSVFGPNGIQTDPSNWNPQNATPGIYWRVVRQQGATDADQRNWGTWITVDIQGHVVTPGDAERQLWIRTIVEQLAAARHVPLTDGSPLEILSIGSNYNAHPMREGQISLSALFGVLLPQPTAPLLLHPVFA